MEDLHFYPPRSKYILLSLVSFLIIAMFVVVAVEGWNEGNYGMFAFGLFLSLSLGALAIYLILKMLFSKNPYLIFKADELVISSNSKNPITLKWEDIKGYNMISVNGNKTLEIVLFDEEKYTEKMNKVARGTSKVLRSMNRASFTIVLGMIQKKDHERFFQELEKRSTGIMEFEETSGSKVQ